MNHLIIAKQLLEDGDISSVYVDDIRPLLEKFIEACEVIKFYGDEKSYGSDDVSLTDGFDCYDVVLHDFNESDTKARTRYAGKRARQFLKSVEGE